ncbi:alcohol dehydrogenase catalytic domain-containing protein [Herbaspirillum sp. WKF16]|uniref:alcohol dehydrogenase catalytic domain-containing protein n=1 Tax=Herbaspirillum sp. WKF16 TaxID=3028312 RepID=UPI0023A9E72B|nr:alcohol dehydrogenase catalytic domain-containing protein [Herbaspirillum sp. WKF16]WDZ97347.1 alcohol dehydrogenase catalytic domain-containing protein [Herbaspirillum sp. WKF16]
MTQVKAWAAFEAGQELKPFTYELSAPESEEVEIEVSNCGVCHTDLVFIDNEWGMTPYPFVPGHEIVGRITCPCLLMIET